MPWLQNIWNYELILVLPVDMYFPGILPYVLDRITDSIQLSYIFFHLGSLWVIPSFGDNFRSPSVGVGFPYVCASLSSFVV